MNPSFVGSDIYKFYFINAKKINNLKFKGKVGNILRIRKSFWDKFRYMLFVTNFHTYMRRTLISVVDGIMDFNYIITLLSARAWKISRKVFSGTETLFRFTSVCSSS